MAEFPHSIVPLGQLVEQVVQDLVVRLLCIPCPASCVRTCMFFEVSGDVMSGCEAGSVVEGT